MAGGVAKGFGSVFLILGILLLLVGVVAAVFGSYDQDQHEENSGPLGVGEDGERSQRNEMLLLGGGSVVVLGLILAIIGGITVGIGAGRSRREHERKLVEALNTGSVGSQAPPAESVVPSDTGPAGDAASDAATPEPASRRALLVVGAIAVGSLLIIGTMALMPLSDEQDIENARTDVLAAESKQGTLSTVVTVGGNSQTPNSATQPFSAPPGTARIEVRVDWDPGDFGPGGMQIYMESQDAGEWVEQANEAVAPGDAFTVTLDRPEPDERSMRFRIFPNEDGVVTEQAYTVHLAFYAA